MVEKGKSPRLTHDLYWLLGCYDVLVNEHSRLTFNFYTVLQIEHLIFHFTSVYFVQLITIIKSREVVVLICFTLKGGQAQLFLYLHLINLLTELLDVQKILLAGGSFLLLQQHYNQINFNHLNMVLNMVLNMDPFMHPWKPSPVLNLVTYYKRNCFVNLELYCTINTAVNQQKMGHTEVKVYLHHKPQVEQQNFWLRCWRSSSSSREKPSATRNLMENMFPVATEISTNA